MTLALRNTLRASILLLIFAGIATAMLATTFAVTRTEIMHNEQQAKRALIAQVLPNTLHDNDLLDASLTLPADEMLGTRTPSYAWVGRKQGQATGVVLEAIAPDGYSGDIALLIGLRADGQIIGVRVTAHKETPGLGDYIDIAKSPWITQFDGKSLTAPPEANWKVQRDGGNFDARAGATITPRAVVKAVHGTLQYFVRHRTRLLGPSPPQHPN
ncbi:MAG: electron transport complex subunit RsxG [Thiobacillus sp.]